MARTRAQLRDDPDRMSFPLVPSQMLLAADRTLAAEGDYIAQTKTGDKPLSHWQLWHLSNGDYEVVDTSTKNASSVQIFRFDSQFLPIGYIKTFGPISTPHPNFPPIPGLTISCQYQSSELTCNAESSEGRKSTTSIAAKPPYVSIGEFYDLDFVWFMAGVVRLASHNGAKDGVVNVYALTDGAKPPDIIGLKPDKPMRIVFAGEETTQVMGKTQVVKKYEWESKELRVTTQGLVVSMESDQLVYAISGYKEYEPWGAIR